jgi:hypothetical protein
MPQSSRRPMKELRLLLMLAFREQANNETYAPYHFPLMVLESNRQVPILLPEPRAEALITNWNEMLPKLESEVAIVDIPYHPPIEEDENIYAFSVFIAYLDEDEIAMAEMILLQSYAEELWKRYRHLAKPFQEPGEDFE